jgi:polyferredoxin
MVLVFQDWIVARPRFYAVLRPAFLGFTLLWLGWYAGVQLSVMNVLTFVHALLTGFRWDFFLLDPLLVILWSFVALAMLFWGRGVFCGWLCPFGALQELTNRAARWLHLPQLRLPFLLHERLWPVKYIAFVGLLAITLQSLEAAQPWTEIEPFKTAVILRFDRSWPFVAYALALLAAGLFVERFFCRYLCPLGAALALPARQRLFEWLKRKRQCGTECQICAVHCPVQAIHPTGQINPHECIHCLNCQKLYYDDHACPPLIERRKRRETRQAERATRPQAQPTIASE